MELIEPVQLELPGIVGLAADIHHTPFYRLGIGSEVIERITPLEVEVDTGMDDYHFIPYVDVKFIGTAVSFKLAFRRHLLCCIEPHDRLITVVSSIGNTIDMNLTEGYVVDPKKGASVLLTMIATINRFSLMLEDKLVAYHLARANRYTFRFFERLQRLGLYESITHEETGYEDPPHDDLKGYFICCYPIDDLGLERFEVEEAASRLASLVLEST